MATARYQNRSERLASVKLKLGYAVTRPTRRRGCGNGFRIFRVKCGSQHHYGTHRSYAMPPASASKTIKRNDWSVKGL
ncbi:hypothetical protein IAQ61_001374 [Plenodomus lingam]|uniref:uncharacterized protein n=1 Tax=Leptosphaeria maculans TaxID=5022 RepID=UPI00331DF8AB|nr:hypothetical protein IAQ61_001374 [Plenodomus lingam]